MRPGPDAPTLGGHVALVTGGSRGIGRATCLALAAAGASIAVGYHRQRGRAEEVVQQIVSQGGRAAAFAADVAQRREVERMVGDAATELGPIDVLINNAGVLFPGSLLDYREDQLDTMWRVNVKGTLHCTAAAAPGMIGRGWGRVVNIASNAGIGTALPGTTLYAATKGAVLTLTRRMAFELGRHGITVNAVLPGFTRTDMTTAGRSAEELERTRSTLDERSVLGRGVGDPEDITPAILFLASEASSFVTGQLLLADGGRTDYLSHA